MFVNGNTLKKIIPGIVLSCTLFFGSIHLAGKNEQKPTKYEQAKAMAYGYGTILAGSAMHEFGHWLVGKKIHKCNGFFYVTPICTGGTILYQNPQKEVLKAIWNNNVHYPIKHISPNISTLAAGPLFGIGFSLLAPLANTFYHEYKQDKSILNALKKTVQQPYFNDKQNSCVTLGAQLSFIHNSCNLSPFIPKSDGNKIVKKLGWRCSANRLGMLGTAAAAMALTPFLKI